MPEIQCVRCGQVGEQLAKPPLRNELGTRVHESICRDCWDLWLKFQTALINHHGLDVRDAAFPEEGLSFLSYGYARDAGLGAMRRSVETLLRDKYNMEPQRMIRYTQKYGPIDWRHPAAHALYWSKRGVENALLRTTEQNQRDYDAFVATEAEWNDTVDRAGIAHPSKRPESENPAPCSPACAAMIDALSESRSVCSVSFSTCRNRFSTSRPSSTCPSSRRTI